jgi:hypothetical protein
MRPIRTSLAAFAALALLSVPYLPVTTLGAPPAAAAPRTASAGTGTWSSLGSGVASSVNQLVRYQDSIVVGGNVDFVGGLSAPAHVGRWDGTSWTVLGNVASSGTNALAIDGSGQVYRALNQAQVERWAGSAWSSAVSPSPNNFVNAMAFDSNGNLFVGGSFTTPQAKLGYWNGSSWSSLGAGPGINVGDIAFGPSGSLVVTGYTGSGIRQWDGNSWSTYGGGMTSGNAMDTVAVDDSLVYVGGGFSALNGQSFRNVAVGVNGVWSALGYGVSNPQAQSIYVYDLVWDDTTGLLYVGGSFTYACGDAACTIGHDDTVPLSYIGAWYPARQKWIPLTASNGQGLNGQVSAMAPSADGSSVYVGGSFSGAGGVSTGTAAQFTWNVPTISALTPSAVPENTPASVTVTGQDFETLSSVTVDGAPVPFTQTDDTTVQISLPAGTGLRQVRAVAAGGISAPATFTFQPPPPPAPIPASAPEAVTARAGDASAHVSWQPPQSSGSFPVTHYRVMSQPGGRACLTTGATSCTIEGLVNGTEYTFTVSALTGAGWGVESLPSNAVTPRATSVVITGTRTGQTVAVTGTVTHGDADRAVPWVRKAEGDFVAGIPRPVNDGAFAWNRRARGPVTVYFTVGDSRSNIVRL